MSFQPILFRCVLLCILFLRIFSTSNAQAPITGLVGYYPFHGNTNDESTYLNHGLNSGATLTTNRFGQADDAYQFNGIDQYIELPDGDQFSISTTNSLTISVWMRSDVLDFTNHESDYVHWMGKGVSSQHEWVLRIYNLNSDRPNRTTCYSFNLSGGLGAGSYVQEDISIGEWVHIVAVYDFQTDIIELYKNGELKDDEPFSNWSITPGNGTAPVRIGTRDFSNYYQGAIDDLRFYNRVLTVPEINQLYQEVEKSMVTEISPSVKHTLISIYPNPVDQLLSIQLSNEVKNIEIKNSIGTILYSIKILPTSHNICTIDVSSFASGLYFVNTKTANRMEVKKFVKK